MGQLHHPPPCVNVPDRHLTAFQGNRDLSTIRRKGDIQHAAILRKPHLLPIHKAPYTHCLIDATRREKRTTLIERQPQDLRVMTWQRQANLPALQIENAYPVASADYAREFTAQAYRCTAIRIVSAGDRQQPLVPT